MSELMETLKISGVVLAFSNAYSATTADAIESNKELAKQCIDASETLKISEKELLKALCAIFFDEIKRKKGFAR